MPVILAVETATEACSVALLRDDVVIERHEIIPRQHNRRLFGLVHALLNDSDLEIRDLTAVAYGAGPGSFTGLRIASSFAQGLCFSRQIPAIPISTLAAIAMTALSEKRIHETAKALVLLDARVSEVYAGVLQFTGGCAELVEGPWVGSPGELKVNLSDSLHLLGSGGVDPALLDPVLRAQITKETVGLYPRAGCMLALAQRALSLGEVHKAELVAPDYVQHEISWKKLSEQGGLK